MLKLPDMYSSPKGEALIACFREVLDAKTVFYKDTSTKNGQAYIEALNKVRDRLLKEADNMQKDADSLPKIKFKATVEVYRSLAEQTKSLGLRLEPISDFVQHMLKKDDRPTTWGACPIMGPQWLFLQHGCVEAMDSCEKLRSEFNRENTAEAGEKVLSRKRVPAAEEFHMVLRPRKKAAPISNAGNDAP